jgi:hypothetical protein
LQEDLNQDESTALDDNGESLHEKTDQFKTDFSVRGDGDSERYDEDNLFDCGSTRWCQKNGTGEHTPKERADPSLSFATTDIKSTTTGVLALII